MVGRGLSSYHCLPSTYHDVFPLAAAQSETKVLAFKYLKENFLQDFIFTATLGAMNRDFPRTPYPTCIQSPCPSTNISHQRRWFIHYNQ